MKFDKQWKEFTQQKNEVLKSLEKAYEEWSHDWTGNIDGVVLAYEQEALVRKSWNKTIKEFVDYRGGVQWEEKGSGGYNCYLINGDVYLDFKLKTRKISLFLGPIWWRDPNLDGETGVYITRCKVNNKCYIGRAGTGFNDRWFDKREKLQKNEYFKSKKPQARRFQKDWNSFGPEAFEYGILVFIPQGRKTNEEFNDKLNHEEKLMIKIFDSFHNGYNSTLGGEGKIEIISYANPKNNLLSFYKKNKLTFTRG